ncbi:phage major capsid protein [Burkholderia cenocepacia]|uniref:phage major capsid protein n=1 Tax=Burkholderia cenocepacia TaxID=95486 RepID=UPI0024B6B14F|nr:phage major capsid protein [Burkholderia cenocepacia]MDI9686572.1 phage major capsid protein [Burkholderia cenocepacia]
MKVSEQIKRVLAQILLKSDALSNIVKKGMDMSDEEVAAAEALKAEVKSLEGRLALLKDEEAKEAAAATAVAEKGLTVTPQSRVEVKDNKQKGASVARVALTLMAARGNLVLAEQMAAKHYKDDAVVNSVVKAAVAAGTTQVAAWAGNLIYPELYAADFIELLYPQTVLGRLEGMRKIPFNVRINGMNGGTQVGWVGEAKNAPVTSASFFNVNLGWNKVNAIAAFSDEIIRFSNPAVEALVLSNLVEATAQGLDSTFLGTAAATAVSPAGMFHGVTPVASGSTLGTADGSQSALDLIADLQTAIAPMIAANLPVGGIRLLMSPARALHLGSLRNPLGAKWFPGLDLNGGTLEGFPVITSNNVAGNVISILLPNEVYLSEDAGPEIDFSREASLIMDSTPDAASSAPVSMFQTNQVAVKIGQFINWAPRRAGISAQISGADKYK